jgi:hypothetical protein
MTRTVAAVLEALQSLPDMERQEAQEGPASSLHRGTRST